jgi:heat shock protein HtpX
MRRREVFPPDHGLQTRMLLAAVLTPLFAVGAVAAVVVVFPANVAFGVAVAVVAGTSATLRARRERPPGRVLGDEDMPDLHATVERLCVLADLPKPDLVLEREAQPNSWMIDLPRRRPRLHVTEGLVDVLEPSELEAVIAHELAHVANRDATVMSVAGLPGTVLAEGGRSGVYAWWPLWLGMLLARGVGALSGLGTSALSRYRELSADAAAARLTGRPAALASALLKVSGELARMPSQDLRAVAARDAFHLLPVERDGRGRRALTATHPSVERRLDALERLQASMGTPRRRYE